MKIKRFFENEVQGPNGVLNLSNDISTSRVEEIIKQLKKYVDDYNKNSIEIDKLENELTRYRGESNKNNDQIDDSVINLQQVNKSIELDVLSKINDIILKLQDYIENGRNYIYGG